MKCFFGCLVAVGITFFGLIGMALFFHFWSNRQNMEWAPFLVGLSVFSGLFCAIVSILWGLWRELLGKSRRWVGVGHIDDPKSESSFDLGSSSDSDRTWWYVGDVSSLDGGSSSSDGGSSSSDGGSSSSDGGSSSSDGG